VIEYWPASNAWHAQVHAECDWIFVADSRIDFAEQIPAG
jgi:hypothetical protein